MKKKRTPTRTQPSKTQSPPSADTFMAALERNADDRPAVQTLLRSIKDTLPALEHLLAEIESDHEDLFYRFYHQSFKVYRLQSVTEAIVEALQRLAPERTLNHRLLEILEQGTGKVFEHEHNRRWNETTRPILEAFAHARYFLEMIVRYGRTLDQPPMLLPSGWAAVLYLYGLR
jgi:hypothetical protein